MGHQQKLSQTLAYISQELKSYTTEIGEPINEAICLENRRKIEQSVSVNPHSFYVEVNIKEQALTWSANVSSFLELSDIGGKNPIRFEHLLMSIHPSYLELYTQFGMAVYRILKELAGTTSNASPYHYHLTFPMNKPTRTNPVNYWWVKQSSHAGLVDENLNLISHINEYRFIEKFEGQKFKKPLVTYVYKRNDIDEHLQNRLIEAVPTNEVLNNIFGYTPREIEIMQLQVQNLKSADIAKLLKVQPQTVDKHNSHIVKKANKVFPQGFQKAKEVAHYFSQLFEKQ